MTNGVDITFIDDENCVADYAEKEDQRGEKEHFLALVDLTATFITKTKTYVICVEFTQESYIYTMPGWLLSFQPCVDITNDSYAYHKFHFAEAKYFARNAISSLVVMSDITYRHGLP